MLWRPALLFVSSRALVLLAFVVAAVLRPALSFHSATSAWDGGFYFDIANHGYPPRVPARGPSRLAFFPAFPAAIRGVETLFGLSAYRAAMIVVFACGLAATCVIWLLTRELSTVDAADRASALFAFAPGSFVLSMAYTEAMFVLCAASACWALVRRRWVLAGMVGAVAAATRPDGLVVALAAACASFVAIHERREWRSLAAVLLSASGFVAVMIYFWRHTGNRLAFFVAERRGWHQRIDLPGAGLRADIVSVLHTIDYGGPLELNHVAPLLGFAFFVGAAVLLLRWRPPVELIGLAAGLGLFALISWHVDFRPRLVMAAFPLSMALGVKLRRGPGFAMVLAVSAALLVVLAILSVATTLITP